MPLVEDDEESEREEKPSPTVDPTIQQVAEKTQTFKGVLSGVGKWLANRKLPPSVKEGLRNEWDEVWTGKHQSKGGRKKKKYIATPFKSFSKNKKSKL